MKKKLENKMLTTLPSTRTVERGIVYEVRNGIKVRVGIEIKAPVESVDLVVEEVSEVVNEEDCGC